MSSLPTRYLDSEEIDWRGFLTMSPRVDVQVTLRSGTRRRSQTVSSPPDLNLISSNEAEEAVLPLGSGRQRSISDPSMPRAQFHSRNASQSYSCASSDLSRQYGHLLSSSVPVPILCQQRIKERKERKEKRAKRKQLSSTFSQSTEYSSSSSYSSSTSSSSPFSSFEYPNLKNSWIQSNPRSDKSENESKKAQKVSSLQFPASRESKAAQILGESYNSHSSHKLSKLLGIDDAQVLQITKKSTKRCSDSSWIPDHVST
eukprot:TRINITY_DN5537_c0_g1_i1.p1 TRINITY_DN5537_c0_g1~~TRINITY_DN5537_c0_g1_i1.p1  ORF type:complete len:258 (-),score=47.39 TRINITY_DN5537_c0_g1_i1:228-1001(-)